MYSKKPTGKGRVDRGIGIIVLQISDLSLYGIAKN